jgi:hypothetical protein
MSDDRRLEVQCSDCELTTTVYADEVRAFYRFHRCYPPAERAILADLIANLRDIQWRHYGSDGQTPTAEIREAADRAEARLREGNTPTESSNERINLGDDDE